jgi:cobalt-zinc-cadmium efflux system outer membrane protein
VQVVRLEPIAAPATDVEEPSAPETLEAVEAIPSPGDLEPISSAAWTLEDLIQIALQGNPTLVKAAAAVQAAEGRYVQQGLYPNPTVGYLGGDIGLENTAGQQGATFRQQVVTAGKLKLARAVASHEIQQARYALDAQQLRVINDVRIGYYEVLLAQKTLEVNEQLVKISDEVVEVNEKLRAQLEVGRPVVLRSRIEANYARLGQIAAQEDYESAWRRLSAVLGQRELPPQKLGGEPDQDLPELTWNDSLGQLLAQSPEIARASMGVERAHCELARQYALRWPNFQVGSWLKSDEPTRDVLFDIEVAVPLPVFDRNQGGIMAAEADLLAAERELQRVELSLTSQLAGAFQRYAVARRQVELYENSILADAQDALELVSTAYREGELGYLDLLVAQTTYFDVNLNWLKALRSLWTSSIELEGMLLNGSLNVQ